MKKVFATLLLVCGLAIVASAQSAGGNTYLDKIEGLGRAHLLQTGCMVTAAPNIAVQYSLVGVGIYRVSFGVYNCGVDRCRFSTKAWVEFDLNSNVLASYCGGS